MRGIRREGSHTQTRGLCQALAAEREPRCRGDHRESLEYDPRRTQKPDQHLSFQHLLQHLLVQLLLLAVFPLLLQLLLFLGAEAEVEVVAEALWQPLQQLPHPLSFGAESEAEEEAEGEWAEPQSRWCCAVP